MTRILVVDDSEVMRRSLSLLLERRGHIVGLADGATQALEHSQTIPFDIVITDLIVDGDNRPELAEELKKLQPKLKVILHSSNRSDGSYVGSSSIDGFHYKFDQIEELNALMESLAPQQDDGETALLSKKE